MTLTNLEMRIYWLDSSLSMGGKSQLTPLPFQLDHKPKSGRSYQTPKRAESVCWH